MEPNLFIILQIQSFDGENYWLLLFMFRWLKEEKKTRATKTEVRDTWSKQGRIGSERAEKKTSNRHVERCEIETM